MKSLLLFIPFLCVLQATTAWRFVSKVEELPVEVTDRLEILRHKVRLCGGDSEESTDCVLCTVCHPHEYELIGCSGQMDSVCASCTTGWMKSTPKTIDFFRKCKKHPVLPLIFPDVPYGYPLKLDTKDSMFADQEKMLKEAERFESAELDDELSEEDYDGDEEEEEGTYLETKESGVNPVLVDERDEDSASGEVELSTEEDTEYEYKFHNDLEKMIAEKFEKMGLGKKVEVVDKSFEEEDSAEVPAVQEEERQDPFDAKTEKKEEAEQEEEESEELQHRVYPLHKVNIWRIIGPEKMRIDDKDISDEVRQAINERTDAWRIGKGLHKQRVHMSSAEMVDDYAEPRQRTIGGYRPLPSKYRPGMYGATMEPLEFLAWCFGLFLVIVILAVAFKMCMIKRRNRVMILPELDDMSRQLINEAHARVHGKKDKKSMSKPEFV